MPSILKNFASIMFSEAINKALGFVLTTYLARTLGVAGFGTTSYALAIFGYFSLLTLFGLDAVAIRRLVGGEQTIKALAFHVALIRAVWAAFAMAGIFVLAYTTHMTPDLQTQLAIYGLTLCLFPLTLDWCFFATEKIAYVAMARTIGQVLNVLIVLVCVRQATDLAWVAWAQTLVTAALVAIFLFGFVRYWGGFHLDFDSKLFSALLKSAWPLVVSAFLFQLMTSVDMLVLGAFGSREQLGAYTAATKVVAMMFVVPQLMSSVIYPRLAVNQHDQDYTFTFVRFMLLAGIPIGVGLSTISEQVIALIYGAGFVGAAQVLAVSAYVVPAAFLFHALGRVIQAAGKERSYMGAVVVGAATCAITCLSLIPRWGILGASYGALFGWIGAVVTMVVVHRRALRLTPLFSVLGRLFVAAGAMGIVVRLVGTHGYPNVLLLLCVGALTYLAMIILLRLVNQTDLARVVPVANR